MNDTIDMFITATLPENFAHILTRFNLQLTVDRATDWDNDMELRMFNHIPGQPVGTSEHLLVEAQIFTPSGTPFRTARSRDSALAPQTFAGPVWAVHGGAITFRVQMANVAATVQAAGFVITHVEFLEYDLTQAQRFWINTPVPVIQR